MKVLRLPEYRRSQLLVEAGATVDATTHSGWTPLHTASKNGHLNVAKVSQNASLPKRRRFPGPRWCWSVEVKLDYRWKNSSRMRLYRRERSVF